MSRKNALVPVLLILTCFLLVNTACEPIYEGRPTGFPTQLPTNTVTPTQAATPTEAPTVTHTLTITPTDTPTPIPTATPTSTPTVIPTRESGLIQLTVGENTTVDWGYHYLTQNNKRDDNSQYNLSAMLAFQLIDRGIHSETITVLGNDITVYYLRARHAFKGEMMDVKIILTGIFGTDVAIDTMPADGANFVYYRTQNADVPFEPWKIDSDWNLAPNSAVVCSRHSPCASFRLFWKIYPTTFSFLLNIPLFMNRNAGHKCASTWNASVPVARA